MSNLDPSSFPVSKVSPNIGNESLAPVEAGQQGELRAQLFSLPSSLLLPQRPFFSLDASLYLSHLLTYPLPSFPSAGTTPRSSRHAPTDPDPTPSAADSSIPKDVSIAQVIEERPRGEDQDGGKVGFMEKMKGYTQVAEGKLLGDEKKVRFGLVSLKLLLFLFRSLVADSLPDLPLSFVAWLRCLSLRSLFTRARRSRFSPEKQS